MKSSVTVDAQVVPQQQQQQQQVPKVSKDSKKRKSKTQIYKGPKKSKKTG